MNHGGKRKGAGAPNKNKIGKMITFNCWPENIDKAGKLSSSSQLSKRINMWLKGAKV